jgi:hypothetical protein
MQTGSGAVRLINPQRQLLTTVTRKIRVLAMFWCRSSACGKSMRDVIADASHFRLPAVSLANVTKCSLMWMVEAGRIVCI